jgi:hypothetical protein
MGSLETSSLAELVSGMTKITLEQIQKFPDPPKKSFDELAQLLEDVSVLVHQKVIRHIKSGGRYRITGLSFREDSMQIVLHYTPMGEHFNLVVFNRPLVEMCDGSRFQFEELIS